MVEYSKNTMFRTVVLIIAFSLLSGSAGYSLGKQGISLIDTNTNTSSFFSQTPEPKAKQSADLSQFWYVWSLLETNYLDSSKLDSQKMVWGAIRGMTQAVGDPYTVYLPPEDNEKTREDLNGAFEGIGAHLGMKDDRVVIIAPLKGMPAEKAGVLAGDIIVSVDGADTYGWSVPEAVERIRGPKGKEVALRVLHDGDHELTDINVVRDTIEVPVVEVAFQDNVAVIRLNQFVETMPGQWQDSVREIVKTCGVGALNCKGVVLDMRNNPGGFLDGAVFVASEFISTGTVVLQQHANGTKDVMEVNRSGSLLDVPLVVLVNKGSASASEIVAGALQVHKRAKIVGTQSFGKGTIQERKELPGNAGLHVTTAKWLLPDESWINEVGITPDIVVEPDPENPTEDVQLNAAVQALLAN